MTGRPFTALPRKLYCVVVRSGGRAIRRSDGVTKKRAGALSAGWRIGYCCYPGYTVEIVGPFTLGKP